MKQPSDTWKLRLIVSWCVVLVFTYLAATFVMADFMHDEKERAATRHEARLDKNKVEAGRTKTEQRQVGHDSKPKNIKVTAGIYVDRIFDVKLRHTHWKVDYYIWFRWSGPNVHPGDHFQIINGEIIKKNLVSKTSIGSEHYELYRITAEITKFFNITRYPRDDHLMTILIEDTKRQFFDLTYVPDAAGSAISSRVKIPGYEIYAKKVVEKGHSYKTRRGDPHLPENYKSTYSQLAFGIGIKRASWGLYIKMFIGIFSAVCLSLLAFFVSPAHTSPRFALGVGAFFASIASIYVISSQIPLSSGYTLTDMVTATSVITIFLTLLTSTMSVGIHHKWIDGPAWAWRLDRVTQIIFLVCYIILNIALALNASL
ncbi:MAG: hypothetical protein HN394_21615 [Rhodospirillaceae bacterium]|jgi:hypothetical protein|nr:hypothetical protein [Rhodospirillaceae bacterium]